MGIIIIIKIIIKILIIIIHTLTSMRSIKTAANVVSFTNTFKCEWEPYPTVTMHSF